MAKPRCVAFLVRGLEPNATYNRKHWRLMCDLAREHQTNLLLVAGHVLDDPDPIVRAHAAVFQLLNPELADGGLVSTTVTFRLPPERLDEFDREMGNFPLVAMGTGLPRRASVSADNRPGAEQLMRHLIEVHGFRRIVHVRGPYPNREAAMREAVWRSELERAGIEVRPEWLVQGSFDFSGLRTIGQDILDHVGTEFDAIVACNDVAAHRVLEDLTRLGYRVPQDYAVCGFDDIEKSQHSRPPLTTVRQPLEEISRLAWTELEKLLSGKAAQSHVVPTEAVFRASCGCAEDGALPQRSEGEKLNLVNHYERTMENFQGAVYSLHNFIRAMNRVTEADQLAPVLHEWLPRLGVSRFAVLRTCTETGQPQEHVCQWEGLLPTAPSHFSVLTSAPPMSQTVVSGTSFALPDWFEQLSPFILGLFPLVTRDTWYGLMVLDLSREAGLVELVLQEQLASVLDRIAREKKLRETETQRRYAVDVAKEITAPLAEVESAHHLIDARLSKLAELWMPFVSALSERGRMLLSRLYNDVARVRDGQADPELRRAWMGALGGLTDPRTVTDNLVRMGYRGSVEELTDLAKVPEFTKVVAFLVQLSDLPLSTASLGTAARSIANYVDALRRSLL